MGFVLMGASIPCACIGLVNSATTLAVTRFFIGLGGSTFVMCQYWSTSMFTKEVAGTANALVTVTPIVHTCLSKVQGCHSLRILALWQRILHQRIKMPWSYFIHIEYRDNHVLYLCFFYTNTKTKYKYRHFLQVERICITSTDRLCHIHIHCPFQHDHYHLSNIHIHLTIWQTPTQTQV